MSTAQRRQRQDRSGRASADRAGAARAKQEGSRPEHRRPDRGRPDHRRADAGGPDRPGAGGAGAGREGPEQARRDRLAADGRPVPAGGAELLTLSAARDALGLAYDEFDLAVQIGEVPTVACGSSSWMVGSREVRRLSAEEGHPLPLLDRLRLVGSPEAAKELGVGRERFVRLARAGHIRPVRWYVNRYQALVWMYLARDLQLLAERSPALLRGPLPEGIRAAVADGEDERARGWRSRRVAQLVRDAYDAWDEAAVWSALLGPELVDSAVPDPYERAHLRRLRAVLPPGRPGPTTPERIRAITTADHPDEIGLGLVALADALGRARKLRPAPGPVGPAPVAPGPPDPHPADGGPAPADPVPPDRVGGAGDGRPGPGRRGLLRLLGRGRRSAGAPPGDRGHDPSHSSPTSVIRTTARSSSSDAARSTSAEMPQP